VPVTHCCVKLLILLTIFSGTQLVMSIAPPALVTGNLIEKEEHMSIVMNFALIVMALVSALAVAAAGSSASASASAGELSVAGAAKPINGEPPAVVIHAAGLQ
jgi:hypothetical protein